MPLKLKLSLEPEEWWKMTSLCKRTNSWKRCKNITKCKLNKREIESPTGDKIKRKWTNMKSIELTWVISWPRTKQPLLLNLLLIDSFLIILKVLPRLNRKTSCLQENNKLKSPSNLRKMKTVKSTSGLSKILLILSISLTTKLNWPKRKSNSCKSIEINIWSIKLLKMLDGQTCTVTWTHFQTWRKIWSPMLNPDQ